MIGDFLYNLTIKDARTAPVLQRSVGTQGASAAAVNVDITFPAIPGEMAFMLEHVSAAGIPGAAQVLQRLEWNVLDFAGTSFISGPTFTFNPALAAAVVGTHSESVELLLMPNERLRARGVFSAGGVANTLSAGFVGRMIPKGNLQLR